MRQEIRRTFDRVAAPAEALANWDAAPGSLESVSESENFVYRFRDPAGNERYMRLSHGGHRNRATLASELEFVAYLAEQGVEVARPIVSTAGNLVETVATEQGDFHAVVFSAVPGVQVKWGTDAENRKYLFERGKSLGRLHRLSQNYQPRGPRRWHWFEDDLFTNPLKYLPESETAARREYEELIHWLLKRPRTPENYGMVHGHFGTFNTRRLPDGTLSVFDFDDCSYHWFLYDIAVSLRSARRLPEKYLKAYVKAVVDGYATEKSLNGEGVAEVARFCRLSALYRFIHSIRQNSGVEAMDPVEQRVLEERRAVLENPPAWY